MRRVATFAAVLAVLALGATAVGGAATVRPAGSAGKTTITFWVGFTGRELGVVKGVVAQFEKSHPAIDVKTVGGISDDKIVAAIRSGTAPDAVQSFSSDNTGSFCSTGAWIDLASYMKRDHMSASIFPKAPAYYTQFKGTRCALPMLADVYGLYYNKALLAKAHITHPPRTIAELTADAKRLTKRDAKGNITVLGFNPFLGWYENAEAHLAPMFGARWTDAKGHSALNTPAWRKLLTWQRKLVDWYGYSNLVRFNAKAGDEWSASNAFERGKVAMHLDGEWRVAFIADEHPELKYGTAPLPTSSKMLYGSGYTSGSIVGIPKTASHKDEAWQLVKYVATNVKAEATLSNELRNVPTISSALHSKLIKPDRQFATFLTIFANTHTTTTPVTAAGAAYQDLFSTWTAKWQAGKVKTKDLAAGLKNVDEQIDAQLANQTGGGVP
jgi:multiple sugar transport system substrate-binding protein